MKVGKVSQTVLKRSIQKQLHYRREESVIDPAIEEMCAGIWGKDKEQTLVTSAVVFGNEKDLGVFALAKAANDLATRGAEPVGAGVHILLPPFAYESRLKTMTELMERAGSAHTIQLLYVKAEVCQVIQTAVVSVTGVGIQKRERLIQPKKACPGQDIVLLKWIGLEGALRILREKEEELKQRFVPAFLHRIAKLEAELFSLKEIHMAERVGASAMQQITDGGILAALWDISEAAHVGIEVEMKRMSIHQETVEICEYYHLNPYQLTGVGSVLIVTENGKELTAEYEKHGIHAVILGRTTNSNEKIILNGGEKRYLDRPAPDELGKIYQSEKENEA